MIGLVRMFAYREFGGGGGGTRVVVGGGGGREDADN
jgi:hypothetical protein